MKLFSKKSIVFLAIIFFQQALLAQVPTLYLVNAAKVVAIKKGAPSSTVSTDNINQLSRQADKVLLQKFGSVMDKKISPPCGNMHEYMSMAKYYWPDPTKPDGKPYIKKDGQKNPENDMVSDDKNFDELVAAVNTLSWAYFFTNEEKYAAKGIGLIRFWFLDTATCMLPNLNHSQIRTGIDTGVSTGIIDTHSLPQLIDNIGLLRLSKYWKASDEAGMQRWFTDYLLWLRTSTNGKKESTAPNNHGTFYDAQVVVIALYCGQNIVARNMLQAAFLRIASQIEPDGRQPLELERTASLGYSTFNLEGWALLANTAKTQGVDLWNYETKDGRGLHKAIDFLLPFAIGEKPWPYKQINPYKPQDFYRLLLIAAEEFKDEKYRKQADKIKGNNKSSLTNILYHQQ